MHPPSKQKFGGSLLQTMLADLGKNTYHTVIVSGVVGVIDDHFRLITKIRQAVVVNPVLSRRWYKRSKRAYVDLMNNDEEASGGSRDRVR